MKNLENTFFSIKKLVGCKYSELQDVEKIADRVVEDDNGNIGINCPALDRLLTPEEVFAQVIRKLVEDASQYLGGKVTQAVINVPSGYNYAQYKAIKKAGTIAGIEVLRIINEPTAASLAYGLDKKSSETIIVFNLGSGTLGVSILEVGDGVFEVLATAGDIHLGGDDFNKKIVDYLIEEFLIKEDINLREDDQALLRLTEAAEKAKVELSSATQTNINLPFITATKNESIHLDISLTRDKFEELCLDIIDRCIVPIEQAIKDSKLSKDAIDEVVMVGGSTRIPAIANIIEKIIGKAPNLTVNPDEVVALGTAIQAGVLGGEMKNILLLGVTPLSLGIEAIDGVMETIIPRNTSIPTKKSETFFYAKKEQTK